MPSLRCVPTPCRQPTNSFQQTSVKSALITTPHSHAPANRTAKAQLGSPRTPHHPPRYAPKPQGRQQRENLWSQRTTLQPYGYTGRRYDNETDLWYFRARYFDDQLGRFISRDPLGYVDGMSMYRGYFVPGGVDSLGLSSSAGMIIYHDEAICGRNWIGVRVCYAPYEMLLNEFREASFSRDVQAEGDRKTVCTECVSGVKTCWYEVESLTIRESGTSRFQKYEFGIVNLTRAGYFEAILGYDYSIGAAAAGGNAIAMEAGSAWSQRMAARATQMGASTTARAASGISRALAAGSRANVVVETAVGMFGTGTLIASRLYTIREPGGHNWLRLGESVTERRVRNRSTVRESEWQEDCEEVCPSSESP